MLISYPAGSCISKDWLLLAQ